MKTLAKIAAILALVTGTAQAQNGPFVSSTARSSYISVMSKAGAAPPRPHVPVRHVQLPPGADAGYNYYYGSSYGYGRGYGLSGASATPSYAGEGRKATSGSLPGYETRPRSSSTRRRR